MRTFVKRAVAAVFPARLQSRLRRFVRSVVRWALADEIERLRSLERESTAQAVSLSRLVDGILTGSPPEPSDALKQPPLRPFPMFTSATRSGIASNLPRSWSN